MACGQGTLPIFAHKQQLVRLIKSSPAVVVIGATGSGKTTQLPQYLLEAGLADDGVIGVTQPRRVAAISVARRVAEELKCPLGRKVGYHVRFDDCTSPCTQLKYMTDGCLLRELLEDECLIRYNVLVLDEAHERSLDTDVLFGLTKSLFLEDAAKRKHCPKLVIMSATLDSGKFSAFFNDCPVFEVSGRFFPVEIVHHDLIMKKDVSQHPSYVAKAVDVAMEIHLDAPEGDILVFLTGQAEIEEACDRLFRRAEQIDYEHDVRRDTISALLILPCYGSMPTDQQQKIFQPAKPYVRKMIVATNIAGTSLTIAGVKYVVDSGYVKQLCHSPQTGLDALLVTLISQSEAIQRAGRAGRTAAGECHRLYSAEVFHECMPIRTVPEIQRTSLTSVILQLKAMAIDDVVNFPYMDPPEPALVGSALKQLYVFDALDRSGVITRRGKEMAAFPLSPSLACVLLSAIELECVDAALPIAAMLSVENVFARPSGKESAETAAAAHHEIEHVAGGSNDFATLLAIFSLAQDSDSAHRWCQENFIHWRAVRMAFDVHRQLQSIVIRLEERDQAKRIAVKGSQSERLRRALCAGYFCNVARRSVQGRAFRTMDGHGSTVYIHPSSVLIGQEDRLDWVIYHDIIYTTTLFMRTVCPVRYEWIKDLLPRLHDVDIPALTGGAAISKETKPQARRLSSSTDERDDDAEQTKLARRNTADSIAAARYRYLQRRGMV